MQFHRNVPWEKWLHKKEIRWCIENKIRWHWSQERSKTTEGNKQKKIEKDETQELSSKFQNYKTIGYIRTEKEKAVFNSRREKSTWSLSNAVIRVPEKNSDAITI